jgi:hypothetical protein
MAGNFKVDPAKVRAGAKLLDSRVAAEYANSASAMQTGGRLDSPGLGLAMSWAEALYNQQLDFLTKDVQGAHDVCVEIASRLRQTADEYDRAEDLNISGFDGKGTAQESYGSAYGQALDNSGVVAGLVGITLGEIAAVLVSVEACAALCPTFIPAAVATPLFAANIPSIFSAGINLQHVATQLKNVVNAEFDQACGEAKDDWEGEGADNFAILANKVKTHMDSLGDYIDAVGKAMIVLGMAFGALWAMILASTVPFLVWLIATRAAEACPPWLQDAVLEPLIEASGGIMAAAWFTAFATVTSIVTAASAIFSGALSQISELLATPDSGKSGTPDMQEFHVDQNYKTPI